MLLLGEGSEATEPYNKYDKIRPHSIRSLQFDQKVRPLSFRPEKLYLFTATPSLLAVTALLVWTWSVRHFLSSVFSVTSEKFWFTRALDKLLVVHQLVISFGLILGENICVAHRYKCGELNERDGLHSFSCTKKCLWSFDFKWFSLESFTWSIS